MSNTVPSSAPNNTEAPPPPPPTTGQPFYPPNDTKMGEAPPPYPGAPAGQYQAYPPQGGYPSTVTGQPPSVQAYYMGPGGVRETTTVYTTTSAPVTAVIVTGNCPRCHVGHLREENNAAMCILVAILAFLFFPIGLLYFLCLPAAVIHTCDHCGYTC